ncbi:undecaprenyl-phosphate glucose phosphotransferase [Prosthecomicrobium hirschii]|uniref:undecaprenyl-phosphate glucose phosphotransferase n=1 Tax=Prosthecodimorpha hirschii TaxID=665126 RepID=UPI001FCD32CA|nr:undecaprenyl-phosphate glucose phosphotransferase [Prosthecomicrobium hirschii]
MSFRDPIPSQPISGSEAIRVVNSRAGTRNASTEGYRDAAVRYRWSPEWLVAITLIADFSFIVVSIELSTLLSDLFARGAVGDLIGNLALGATFAAVFIGILALRGGYKLDTLRHSRHQVRLVAGAVCIAFFLMGWFAFLSKTTATFSRLDLTVFFVVNLIGLTALHWSVSGLLNSKLAKGELSLRRAVVIADGRQRNGDDFQDLLRRNGIEVVELIEVSPSQFRRDDYSLVCRHALERAQGALSHAQVDGVFLFLGWNDRRAIDEMRVALSGLPVPVHLFADVETERVLRRRHLSVGGMHGYELQRAPLDLVDRTLKRVFDVAVSVAALLLLGPLMVLIACAIRVEGGGTVIFRQKRKGFGGRPFYIYKFRTMTCTEDGAVVTQATRNDPRVTRIGAVLRKTSADELPQFVNVLMGHMSVCGPRPHAIAHDNLYDRIIARYAFRHHVKPGITGWAQVNGYRGETRDTAKMEARVEHDIWYVNNWSIWLDVRILLRTFLSGWVSPDAY